MKSKENAAVRSYERKLLSSVPYGFRKGLKNFLTENMDEFCSAHPAPTMDELIEQFGEPNKLAADYFSNLEPDEYQKLFNNVKRVQRWCALGFLVLFLLGVITFRIMILENRRTQVHYIKTYPPQEVISETSTDNR